MSTRRAVIAGIVATVLVTIQHLWRTAGRPAFAPGDKVTDTRTGATGSVLHYHRWPHRYYVVKFGETMTAVPPEYLTRVK